MPNLGDDSKFGVNNISANFSNFPYTPTGFADTVLNVPQHITRFGNPIIKDKINWTQVNGIYTGGGWEKYITIGNFKNNANTDTTRFATGVFNGAYYYIDAVSVYALDPTGAFPWAYRDTTVNYGDSVYIGNYLGGDFSSDWYLQGGGLLKMVLAFMLNRQ